MPCAPDNRCRCLLRPASRLLFGWCTSRKGRSRRRRSDKGRGLPLRGILCRSAICSFHVFHLAYNKLQFNLPRPRAAKRNSQARSPRIAYSVFKVQKSLYIFFRDHNQLVDWYSNIVRSWLKQCVSHVGFHVYLHRLQIIALQALL